MRIYVAHSSVDQELVNGVSAAIWMTGHFPVLPPYEKRWGEPLKQKLYSLMKTCQYVVVIFTESAAQSQWVQWEIDQAETLGIPLRFLVHRKAISELPPAYSVDRVEHILFDERDLENAKECFKSWLRTQKSEEWKQLLKVGAGIGIFFLALKGLSDLLGTSE